jgi:hypothetical protein
VSRIRNPIPLYPLAFADLLAEQVLWQARALAQAGLPLKGKGELNIKEGLTPLLNIPL